MFKHIRRIKSVDDIKVFEKNVIEEYFDYLIEFACTNNKFELFKYLYETCGYCFTEQFNRYFYNYFDQILNHDNIEFVKYVVENKLPYYNQNVNSMFNASKNLKILIYCHKELKYELHEALRGSIYWGNIHSFEYCVANDEYVDFNFIELTCANDNVDMLVYLRQKGYDYTNNYVNKCIDCDSFKCIKYALDDGCYFSEDIMVDIAMKHNHSVTKKIKTIKERKTMRMFGFIHNYFVKRNLLTTLNTSKVILFVAKLHSLKFLKYVISLGYKWHRETTSYMAYNDVGLNLYKYALTNGCKWENNQTLINMSSNKNFHHVIFALKNGCKLHESFYKEFFRRTRWNIFNDWELNKLDIEDDFTFCFFKQNIVNGFIENEILLENLVKRMTIIIIKKELFCVSQDIIEHVLIQYVE